MKARLKAKEVDFVRHVGPNTLVVVGKKGEQRAQPGDVVLISGNTPQDREVISAKDFADGYEVLNEDGSVIDSSLKNGEAYGRPNFDTIEQAQAAAQLHYAPEKTPEDGTQAKPLSSEPFLCTIGDGKHLYAIQPSGVVAQVPVAMQDSTIDPGFPTSYNVAEQVYPNTLENQGGLVREGTEGGLPASRFQHGTAAEETPVQTQGNTLEQPEFTNSEALPEHHEDEPTEENTAPEGAPHESK